MKELIAELSQENPHIVDSMAAALRNVRATHLLDRRYLAPKVVASSGGAAEGQSARGLLSRRHSLPVVDSFSASENND
jgi:hypothetical protein